MSSEIFESQEDDLRTILSELKEKVERQLTNRKGEARKKTCREIERQMEEAKILISEMEEEARRAPTKYRIPMMNKVKHYRQESDSISHQMLAMTSDDRHGVRTDTTDFYDDHEFEDTESSQRSRLLAGTQSLTQASNSLARIHRVTADTDEVGTEIISELGTQRETLVRTRDRLHHTDVNLSKSRRILEAMRRGLLTNKIILAVIIIMEFTILGGVIYWKFFT